MYACLIKRNREERIRLLTLQLNYRILLQTKEWDSPRCGGCSLGALSGQVDLDNKAPRLVPTIFFESNSKTLERARLPACEDCQRKDICYLLL